MELDEKEEARRREMARQRERLAFWERHERSNPSAVSRETRDKPHQDNPTGQPAAEHPQ